MLTNFAWVVEGVLARSGRPQPADYPWVNATFKEVISFEGEAEDWKEADGFAVPLLSLPINFAEIYFTGISQKCLNEDLGAIQQAPPKEKAMQEALDFGYRRFWNRGLDRTWSNFVA